MSLMLSMVLQGMLLQLPLLQEIRHQLLQVQQVCSTSFRHILLVGLLVLLVPVVSTAAAVLDI